MISKYSHKGLNWIDLESPSKEEIEHAIEQLSIPPYIQEKIQIKGKEDIIDLNDDFIIINIGNKIIFIVCDKYALSIHDRPIQAFDKFSKELELDIIVEEKSKIKNHKLLFAHLFKHLYLDSENQLNRNVNAVRKLESMISKKTKRLKLFTILSIMLLVFTIILLCL